MCRRLTEDDGRTALRDHVVRKALEARDRHGVPDAESLEALLEDRAVVRYPVTIEFDEAPLRPGEFAWPVPLGDHPADGFRLVVHPCFERRREALPLLVAYHLPSVNYGDIVTHEEAEAFGATLLGLEVDDYYRHVCTLADSVPWEAAS